MQRVRKEISSHTAYIPNTTHSRGLYRECEVWRLTAGSAAVTATPRAEEMVAVGDVTRLLAAAWTAARVAEGLVAIGAAPGAAAAAAG